MAKVYHPLFVTTFKEVFPEAHELHEALDKDDISHDVQKRLMRSIDDLKSSPLTEEVIIQLHEAGRGDEVLARARENVRRKKLRQRLNRWKVQPYLVSK